MSPYSLREYIRYKWQAKSRHGIHSPFVYDFIEHVLLNKELQQQNNSGYISYNAGDAGNFSIKLAGVPEKYMVLIATIIAYYNSPNQSFQEKPEFRFSNAENTGHLSEAQPLSSLHILIVSNIHTSKHTSANWKNIYTDPKVRLSIDLYHIGILFFRNEFKEKQHFTLKY